MRHALAIILALAALPAGAQQAPCTNQPGDLPCSLQRVPEIGRFEQRFSNEPLSYETAPHWHGGHSYGRGRSEGHGSGRGARGGGHYAGHTGFIASGGRGGGHRR